MFISLCFQIELSENILIIFDHIVLCCNTMISSEPREQSRFYSPLRSPALHYIFWEWYAFKFLFMSFLFFLCSHFSHGLEVMSASDSLICFTWLLLICCHLRKTNYIRIIWKVRIIILWLWFRKPLIWVRCITFSVGSLVTHPLSDYFLMLANIQSQSQIVGNHSLGSLPGIKEVKVWVTWINKQNKYITDGLTVLRGLSIP